ncbi:Holliday junction resolvase YqgF [Calothrix parasitica NIES-267]|uniref:Putative pre-16S rRNA nuclease n=1 Tax=Calothrix parasitica NIES-267 TaxID=1973488 RepID=A0A1Z4LI57_9CYAN|nr:Holliday junction resolvase YqgF [Calothrix parasitica NIES-267]
MTQEEREDEANNAQISSQTSKNTNKTFYVSALGLDVGSKRIGIAGCDRTGLIATGITTLHRTTFVQDVEELKRIIQERDVEILVVGLPYSMDGSLGFQARQVQKFTKRITAILKLPVEYVDERLTSYQAEQMIIAERRSPSRNKGLIDRKAAALILQQWLDTRRQQQKALDQKNAQF